MCDASSCTPTRTVAVAATWSGTGGPAPLQGLSRRALRRLLVQSACEAERTGSNCYVHDRCNHDDHAGLQQGFIGTTTRARQSRRRLRVERSIGPQSNQPIGSDRWHAGLHAIRDHTATVANCGDPEGSSGQSNVTSQTGRVAIPRRCYPTLSLVASSPIDSSIDACLRQLVAPL